MANEQNLIPGQHKLTVEEQSRGGTNSAASRRRKKALKDAADLFLSLPVTDNRVWNKLARKGVDPEDIDNQMAMICGLHAQACAGDAKAGKLLWEILGEKADRTIEEGVQIVDDL